MVDISNLAPDLAHLIGVNQATFVLLIVLISWACKVTARVIPDDATGWQGIVRKIASIIALEISNRITANATSTDILKAAVATPPIPQKIAEQAEQEKAS